MSRVLVVRAIRGGVPDVAEVLRLAELDVVEVFDLYEAAAAARRHQPHVIVLELGHRAVDTVQLGLDVLAFLPTASVVLLAERVDRPVIDAAEELQASGWLQPGDDVDRLLDVVAHALRLSNAKRGQEPYPPDSPFACEGRRRDGYPTSAPLMGARNTVVPPSPCASPTR